MFWAKVIVTAGNHHRLNVKEQRTRSADDLSCKSVSRPFEAGIVFDGDILGFEDSEVGVEVIYEITDLHGGRVVKFKVSFIYVRLHYYPTDSLSGYR